MLLKAIVNVLSRFKAWFANLEFNIKTLNLFGTTYHNELIIVVDSIEKMYRKKKQYKEDPEELFLTKRMIERRMEEAGLLKKFNKLLVKHKLMDKKKLK